MEALRNIGTCKPLFVSGACMAGTMHTYVGNLVYLYYI